MPLLYIIIIYFNNEIFNKQKINFPFNLIIKSLIIR